MELRKHWAIALVIALAIVVVYLPALIVPYGLTDDYLYLAQAEELELSVPSLREERHAHGCGRGPAVLGCCS